MNELIEKLLQPVSPEQPCGPDLSNDPRFDELETILKGKPEVEVGSVRKPAEPPDWISLKAKCTEFLGKSKHLRVAMMLCGSLVKTGGLAGFRDGVQFLRELLEQYWPTVYPMLDPTDNNDPTQRLNILSALTMPLGSPVISGWLTILGHLRTAPICQPKGGPPVTFEQIEAARQKVPVGEGAAAAVPGLDANLRLQDEAAQRLRNFRHVHGALTLETTEVKPVFTGDQIHGMALEQGNRAKGLIEDFAKPHHEILLNWKEVENQSARPLKAWLVDTYKKIYYIVQLLQYFVKSEE